jgi:hypothetical protein
MASVDSFETVKREKTLLLYAVISSVELMTCGKVCRLARALIGGMTRSVSVHDVLISFVDRFKLQIIVCADGAAGINFEHTGVDGHTVLRYPQSPQTFFLHRSCYH